jgi:hypothetical protein
VIYSATLLWLFSGGRTRAQGKSSDGRRDVALPVGLPPLRRRCLRRISIQWVSYETKFRLLHWALSPLHCLLHQVKILPLCVDYPPRRWLTEFWDVAPCVLAERFAGAYCLQHQGDRDGATSQKIVIFILADART